MPSQQSTWLSGARISRSLALWLVLLLWPGLCPAGVWRDPKIEELVVAGTDRLLNLDYPEAEKVFSRLSDLDSTGLLAQLYGAFVKLARVEDREATPEELDGFLATLTSITAKAEEQLRHTPEDPDLLLFLGMAWGSKAMIDGVRGNYLSTYEGIKRTRRYFDASLQHGPTKFDAYYGLGLYDYTLSRLSWFYRPLVHLVLPPGDRERGLRALALAGERGTVTRMLAKFALLQTYTGLEKDYGQALPLAEELLRRFPGNPELYFQAALVYSELGRFTESLEVGRRIRANLEQGRHHFKREMLPRYFQLMGKVYMDHGDYLTALSFFRKTIDQPTTRYAWVTAWAWTRTGMIHDLLGERREATKSYRMALAVKTDGMAKEIARQYLDEPYRKETARQTFPTVGGQKEDRKTP
ncbi:MAG: tetratricopeptide repeat protein [Candidatus Methylomirabilis oxyfera]|nr:tetratricopeptide repeat protein [Candidatus Methylomirabilis oxyfera]